MEAAEKFQYEFEQMRQRRKSLTTDAQQARNQYVSLQQKRKKLLALGDTTEAAKLKPEIDELEAAWREKAQAAEGIDESQNLEQLVASSPDSKIYKLAKEAIEQGNSRAEKFRDTIEAKLNIEIPQAKQAYLNAIKDLSSLFAEWFSDANQILRIQKFLEKMERIYHEPSIPMPNSSNLTIDIEDIQKVYTRRSTVVNLPK